MAGLEARPSLTRDLRIHGYRPEPPKLEELNVYGSDAAPIEGSMRERPEYAERLHDRLPVRVAQVVRRDDLFQILPRHPHLMSGAGGQQVGHPHPAALLQRQPDPLRLVPEVPGEVLADFYYPLFRHAVFVSPSTECPAAFRAAMAVGRLSSLTRR